MSSEFLVAEISSVTVPEGSPPHPTRESCVKWRSRFKRKYECGHRDSRRFIISVYGDTSLVLKQKEFCSECMIEDVKNHLIICAFCGNPIMEDQAVGVYSDSSPGIRADATHIGSIVLGCLRTSCAMTLGAFGGHWTRNGYQRATFRSVA
jgi:hypothetical protein